MVMTSQLWRGIRETYTHTLTFKEFQSNQAMMLEQSQSEETTEHQTMSFLPLYEIQNNTVSLL